MIRLDLSASPEIAADLGRGVVVRFRRPTFAQVEGAKLGGRAAWRAARLAGLDEAQAAGALAAAVLAGLYPALLGWEGVETPDGPAPLTPETFGAFADAFPEIASRLLARLTEHAVALADEGNGSAASRPGEPGAA